MKRSNEVKSFSGKVLNNDGVLKDGNIKYKNKNYQPEIGSYHVWYEILFKTLAFKNLII